MSTIVTGYNPNDWKELASKDQMITCDLCRTEIHRSARIEKSGQLPEGWLITRERFPWDADDQYSLTVICPLCNADEQSRYQIALMDLAVERFERMKQAAIDWQYLVAQAGGIARKSDCDAWLTQRYGIDDFTARKITNQISDGPIYFMCGSEGIEWKAWTAGRPAPTREQYPEIEFLVYERL